MENILFFDCAGASILNLMDSQSEMSKELITPVEHVSLEEMICDIFNIMPEELFNKGRRQAQVDARRVCFFILNRIYDLGPTRTCKYVNKQTRDGSWDHATIIYSTHKHEILFHTDKNYREKASLVIEKSRSQFFNQSWE